MWSSFTSALLFSLLTLVITAFIALTVHKGVVRKLSKTNGKQQENNSSYRVPQMSYLHLHPRRWVSYGSRLWFAKAARSSGSQSSSLINATGCLPSDSCDFEHDQRLAIESGPARLLLVRLTRHSDAGPTYLA